VLAARDEVALRDASSTRRVKSSGQLSLERISPTRSYSELHYAIPNIVSSRNKPTVLALPDYRDLVTYTAAEANRHHLHT